MMAFMVAYTRSTLAIVMQGPMLVGSVEDWATSKKIARLPSMLNLMTDMIKLSLTHTIGQMSHTLTTSLLITKLTFKAILKELVSSVIGNKRAFCPKLQTTLKTPVQPFTSGTGQIVMPVMTTVARTSLNPTTSLPTPTVTGPGDDPHSVNPNRGPPQTWHQAVMSQGARFNGNKPVTSQVVVQLLDVIDEVTEELQCKGNTEEANSMEEIHEIVDKFQELPQ